MNDFFEFLIQFIILWYITGFFIKGMLSLMEGKRQAKLAEIEKLDEIVHRVKVEKHEDIYYWFDEDDGEFLAQGKNLNETISVVKSRFPSHVFFLNSDNLIYKIHAPNWTLDPFKI